MDAGADLETCLRDHPALAGELRPLLLAARSLRHARGSAGEPSAAVLQAGRARMRAALARESERAAPLAWAAPFARPFALAAVAAVVAAVAAVGLTTNLFDFGATSTSAHVEGVVSRVDTGSILLITSDGQVVVRLGDKTVLLDAAGQPISGGDIIPGTLARVEADEEDGEFHANNIEFEDDDDDRGHGAEVEFSGVVQSISGDTLQLQSSFGAATVRIDAGTEVKGTLAIGADIEVHAARQSDGSYLAREIESEGGGDGGGSGDDDSGPGSGDDGSNSGPGSSSSGPGDDSGSGSDDGGSDSSGSGSGDDDDEHEEDDDGPESEDG
jgi:hypothetical protein